ncbi:universal stress protein [Nocardioides bruguierae]|uniref:Universal stress protein n=1 Tax=Nocardioides bruguierae TaxID=2945102 RepID=A0A9X2D8U2_9ACTN|nr:universal stress protein [Nocardioides bruguierae]MCM0621461.1 universal stress protein [Nocardioides bruguierae]
MTVLVAVTDSPEGQAALAAGLAEARQLDADVVVMNLGLEPLGADLVPSEGRATVVNRAGRGDRDPVHAVLDEIGDRGVSRLVIGLKRRTAVGKALLGSVSQRLLLESPVPVLAVKIREQDPLRG